LTKNVLINALYKRG